MTAGLRFVTLHLNKSQVFWKNNGLEYIKHININFLIPTVKHGGGGVMISTCFVVKGPGQLVVTESTMNSSLYQSALALVYCQQLNLGRNWIIQQTNDLKHSSKSTTEWLKKNIVKVLHWLSQSPDFNLIEMLRQDLKELNINECLQTSMNLSNAINVHPSIFSCYCC